MIATKRCSKRAFWRRLSDREFFTTMVVYLCSISTSRGSVKSYPRAGKSSLCVNHKTDVTRFSENKLPYFHNVWCTIHHVHVVAVCSLLATPWKWPYSRGRKGTCCRCVALVLSAETSRNRFLWIMFIIKWCALNVLVLVTVFGIELWLYVMAVK